MSNRITNAWAALRGHTVGVERPGDQGLQNPPQGPFDFNAAMMSLGQPTASGNIATAQQCVRVIVESLARCPWVVGRTMDARLDTWERIEHPVNAVLNMGSGLFDAAASRKYVLSAFVRSGDGWYLIGRNDMGQPMELIPADVISEGVFPNVRRRAAPAGTQAIYSYPDPRDLIGIHNETFDGVQSLSPIAAHAKAALSTIADATRMFSVKMRTGDLADKFAEINIEGIDDFDAYMTKLSEALNKRRGVEQAGDVRVLPPRVTLSRQPNFSAVDMQLLGIMQWSAEDVCRAFGLHPRKAYIFAGENIRSLTQLKDIEESFVRETILGRVQSVEEALTRHLLTSEERAMGLKVRVATEVLSRGTMSDRALMAEMLAARAGILTINEAREWLGKPPIEGGDRLLPPKGAPEPPGMGGGNEPPEPETEDDDDEEMENG